MSKKKNILKYLKKDIIGSINADLVLALKQHEKLQRGGFFSISRQVFCYLDYLGSLLHGENSTKNALKYMNDYMAKVNPKYGTMSTIMYNMWRHGTVHEYDPKTFKNSKDGYRLVWGANNDSKPGNRKWHLACFCSEKNPNLYVLWVNLFQLVADLKKSIRFLINEIELNPSRLKMLQSNFEKISKDIEIQNKVDLKKESLDCISDSVGVINTKGTVIRKFKSRADFDHFRRTGWKSK